jgi:hypothetical protein
MTVPYPNPISNCGACATAVPSEIMQKAATRKDSFFKVVTNRSGSKAECSAQPFSLNHPSTQLAIIYQHCHHVQPAESAWS